MKRFALPRLLRQAFLACGSIAAAASLGVAHAKDADQHASEVNLTSVNRTLTSAVEEFLLRSENIKELRMNFDPAATSLAQDRYGLRFEGNLLKTGWSEWEVPMKGGLGFRADSGKITISFNVEAQTDSVAMWRYLAKSSRRCPVAASITGVQRIVGEEDCQANDAFANVRNLRELTQVTSDHIESVKKRLRAFMNSAESQVRGVSDETLRYQAQAEIQKTRSILQALENGGLQSRADGFRWKIANADLGTYSVSAAEMDVTANRTQISLTLQTPTGAGLYAIVKPEIVRMMRALQRGEEWARQHVVMELRMTEALVNAYLNVEPREVRSKVAAVPGRRPPARLR